MFVSILPHPLSFWALVTRLGEAQILLPALALAMWGLMATPTGRRLALAWLGLLAAAVALTTASKVAFIGWGLGWPQIDFTGISGHAMFAAAIYPLLAAVLVPAPRRVVHIAAMVGGALLAVLVGISRVETRAHSTSETMAGLLLGGAVVLLALLQAGLADARIARPGMRLWLPVIAAVWFAVTPWIAPPSNSHSMVTQLALKLAGRQQPFLRETWLHDWRRRHPRVV